MAENAYTWQFRAEGGQEASSLFGIIERLDKILQRLTQRESDVQNTFRSMGSASRTAADSTRTFTSAVADVTKETIKTANGVTTISTEYDRMGKVLRRTVDDVNTLGDTTSKTRRVFDAQGNVIKRTSETLTDYREKTTRATVATRQDAIATEDAAKKKLNLFSALTKAAGIWNTWNKAVDFAAKRIRQLYDGFTALFSKVQEIGGAFERSRATMEVLAKSSGATQSEIDALVARTKDLGRTTEFTAQQAADGAVTLLKAGETASTAWTKLGVALDGALATGLEIDKVAAIGNHAFKIFGDNLGKVGDRAMDYDTAMRVMIASANAADVTVSQLDASLVKGGDILARLGVPLTRVNTALGLMANKGFTGSTAMRQLSIGVKRLVDGTRPAAAALKTLGVEAVDSEGNFRDLGAVMQDIKTALDLRAPNEQIKLMKDLFGAADKSMGALLDAGVRGFDQLEEKILQNLNVMDDLKEARADTMIGSFKQFQSAVQGVYIELTEVLSVPIQEFWQTLANILNLVSDRIINVAKNFKDGKGTLQEWLDAIKGGSFDGIFDGLPEEMAPHIDTLKTLFKGLVDAVINLFKNGLADAAVEIWDAFFTDDIKDKAVELGTEVGRAILKGIMSTGIGKVIGVSIAANLTTSVAGAISNISGMLSSLGIGGAGAAGAGAGGAGAGGGMLAGLAPAAGVGLVAGAAVYGGIKVAEGHYNAKAAREEAREVQVLVGHLQKMVHLKEEISEIPLSERTDDDTAKLERINEQIAQTGDELEKLGATGPEGDFLANYYAGQVDKAKEELNDLKQAQQDVATEMPDDTVPKTPQGPIDWGKEYEDHKQFKKFQEDTGSTASREEFKDTEDYEKWRRVQTQREENARRQELESQRQAKVDAIAKERGLTTEEAEKQYRVDEAMKKAKAGEKPLYEPDGGGVSEASEEQLEAKKALLAKQDELIAAEKKQKEAIEESTAVLTKTQIEINNVGAAFEKWMLNPVNIFQQKLMGIKEQFSGIVDNLQGKKVDLEEKFGLKSAEEANAKRIKNIKASLGRDEKLLSMAQTPEEEMKVRERMAGKAEQLADLSEGPQKEQFARQAADYYEKAEASAAKAEELRIKEVEIEQENARKNLAEYEKLVQNAQTAGSRAGYLEQLKEAYMSLGPEYQEKAVQAQEDWKQSKAEAAAEESENFKRIAEASEIQVELLQRAVDALESAATATKEQMHIPPDAGYADAA